MNQRLIPRALPPTLDFDPVREFPADIERLVIIAASAGYELSARVAAELWRRYAGDVCASWFPVEGTDEAILAILLEHGEVVDTPPPPDGYTNWLDYAVDSMDTRSEEIERLFADKPASRQSMRDAVHAELAALRRKAGEI